MMLCYIISQDGSSRLRPYLCFMPEKLLEEKPKKLADMRLASAVEPVSFSKTLDHPFGLTIHLNAQPMPSQLSAQHPSLESSAAAGGESTREVLLAAPSEKERDVWVAALKVGLALCVRV